MKQHDDVRFDIERVRTLLGRQELNRVLERLHKRMSRGEPLTGKIQLSNATSNERAAIDRLFGRPPTQGSSLSVDLDELARTLAHAKICETLEEAIAAILGPVVNTRLQSATFEKQWENVWQSAIRSGADNAGVLRWISDLKVSGLVKRLTGGNPQVAAALLDQSLSIVKQVPLEAVRLAELAAVTTGDSHALDRGQPLSALVIRFARQLDDSARWNTTAERRDAWESLGVLCDEVSAPVLVLNLRADIESLTGRALNLHADEGEPYRISVRQLRLHPPIFDSTSCGPDVFVCENPTVVDVAANQLGRSCLPLVCLDGQPKTSSRLLLDALAEAGIRIRYHGDFDWDGIRIANTIMHRHGATSWRFNGSDYEAVAGKEHQLKGAAVAANWDSSLTELMVKVGKCVHEEHVLSMLLPDLVRE